MMYILIGAIAIGIGGMIFAATLLFQPNNDQIEDRLASLTKNGGRGVAKGEDGAKPSLLLSPLDDAPNKIEEFINQRFNLRKFLEQTGKEITVPKFLAVTAAAGGGAAVLTLMFSPWKSLVPVSYTHLTLPTIYSV